VNEYITAYERALVRFEEWLAPLLRDDGSLATPGLPCWACMSLPAYAHVTGKRELLARTILHIEREWERDDRFFHHPALAGMLPYVPAWMLSGAAWAGHVRLREKLVALILSFQDAKTGGLFGAEAHRQAGAGEIEFDSTTHACAALCLAGRIAEADRMGQYLAMLVNAQPDADRFFLVWDTGCGLVRGFDPATAKERVLDPKVPRQYLYKSGLLIRALALLHLATGKRTCLDLARQHCQWVASRFPEFWRVTLSHKMAWAAVALFEATGDRAHLTITRQVADYLVELQQPDGSFRYPELWPTSAVNLEDKIDAGCQFGTWIALARLACLPGQEPLLRTIG